MAAGTERLYSAGILVNLPAMRLPIGLLSILIAAFTAAQLWAGGSGLNVIVVINQDSTNSVQLGNAYCEQRGVPPQNVLRMTNWPPANGVAECLLPPRAIRRDRLPIARAKHFFPCSSAASAVLMNCA